MHGTIFNRSVFDWTLESAAGVQSIGLVQGPQPRLEQPEFGVFGMATQIVMDRTGDTRHTFDAQDRAAVTKAERRLWN